MVKINQLRKIFTMDTFHSDFANQNACFHDFILKPPTVLLCISLYTVYDQLSFLSIRKIHMFFFSCVCLRWVKKN